jgi:uncharacterized membrane protein
MMQINFTGSYRFLAGILLVQVLTALQVVIALNSASIMVFISFGMLSLMLGLIAAVWFTILAAHPLQDTDTLSPSSPKAETKGRRRKTKKAGAKQNPEFDTTQNAAQTFKLSGIPSIAIVIIAGLGTLILLSQLVTVSLLIFGTLGGVFVGYVWRLRQELRHKGGLVIMDSNSLMPDRTWGPAYRVYTASKKKPPIDIAP